MKKLLIMALCAMTVTGNLWAKRPLPKILEGVHCATDEDYQWWRDARFGMFIHWGPGAFVYSNALTWEKPKDRVPFYELGWAADHTKADELSIEDLKKYANAKAYNSAGRHGIPPKSTIYNSLYKIFNPTKFNADAIAQLAKDAGAGYVVLTTKHHDGFCMWDSKYTDYDMMSTPYKHDICGELAEACHKRGLRVLWYYSLVDFHEATHNTKDPDGYTDYLCNQIQELMTKYKPIEGIWWDGGKIKMDNPRIFKIMNTIHPGALSNARIGWIPSGISFACPEQHLGTFQNDRPWETCAVTTGSSWIWNGGKNIKSPTSCIQTLVGCAIGDGNLLLNLGPKPDGSIDPRVKKIYLSIGNFLKKNGESIYKTRGGPYLPGNWGGSTRRGNTIYLHITEDWPVGRLELPPLPAKIKSCTALGGGKVKCEQSDKGVVIKMKAEYQTYPDTIIKLTMDRDIMDMPLIKTLKNPNSLTTDSKVTASSSVNPTMFRGSPETVILHSFESGKVHKEFGEVGSGEESIYINRNTGKHWTKDEIAKTYKKISHNHRGHFWRYWKPKNNDKQPWLEVDLGAPKTFSKISIRELFGQVRLFEIQIFKNGEWVPVYKGKNLDNLYVHLKKPVTAQRVRLLILETSGEAPSISWFDLFE